MRPSWSAYNCVACLTLLASGCIEPSLHWLGFFLEVFFFYGDLFLFFFGMISEISISVKLSLYMIVINNVGVCS